MNVYIQRTGEWFAADGERLGVGYSGKAEYKNDPASEAIRMLGPIPAGEYLISGPRSTVAHGPYVLPLTPDGDNEMYGRGGFLIHGDSIGNPGNASQGCIILPKDVRVRVWESGDRLLRVVAERTDVCRMD